MRCDDLRVAGPDGPEDVCPRCYAPVIRPVTDAELAGMGLVALDGIKAAFDAGFEAAPRDWRNSDGYTKKRHDVEWQEYERKVLAALDLESDRPNPSFRETP